MADAQHAQSVVAYLRFQDHDTHEQGNLVDRDISPREEFDIGREQVQDYFGQKQPNISAHHLRFRCVVYDDDESWGVPPMVYVRDLSTNGTSIKKAGIDVHDGGYLMTKDQGDVLLSHGDRLYIAPTISIVFHTAQQVKKSEDDLGKLRAEEIKILAPTYIITPQKLGVGAQASVFVAVKQPSRRQLACKIVPLPSCKMQIGQESHSVLPTGHQETQDEKSAALEAQRIQKQGTLAREYEVLKHLSHPNIIALDKVLATTFNIYIFQELITGGDLFTYLEQRGPLTESQAAVIVRQLLEAVGYLHDHQVVHRDIKPENVLMTSWRDGARLVLTDFGQARKLQGSGSIAKGSAVFRMQSIVGTHGYMAPELSKVYKPLNKDNLGYSKAVDMWSIGCITATLLTGDLVFSEQHSETGAEQGQPDIQNSQTRWDIGVLDTGEAWCDVGRKAKAFVKALLAFDDRNRLTAKEALAHDWLSNRHYAEALELVYKKAISDWKPRKNASLIQYLDTSSCASKASMKRVVNKYAAETTSPYFAAPETLNRSSFPCIPQHTAPKRGHTPLPTITEDEEAERSQVGLPEEDRARGCEEWDDARVPDTPPGFTDSMRRLSVHDDTLDDQLSASPLELDESFEQTQMEWNSTGSPSQLIVDEVSPVRHTSLTHGDTSSFTRTASVAESRTSFTNKRRYPSNVHDAEVFDDNLQHGIIDFSDLSMPLSVISGNTTQRKRVRR